MSLQRARTLISAHLLMDLLARALLSAHLMMDLLARAR
jgi:hypothetical protein